MWDDKKKISRVFLSFNEKSELDTNEQSNNPVESYSRFVYKQKEEILLHKLLIINANKYNSINVGRIHRIL